MKKGCLARISSGLVIAFVSLVLTVGLLEISLRVFFPVSDVPIRESEPGLGIHLAPNQSGTNVVGSTGEVRGRYRVNLAGWNSLHEYVGDKSEGVLRIAVIGDSYVEALQVDVDQALPAMLEKALAEDQACAGNEAIEVYGFGSSGAPLSQYMHVMRYVADRYAPDIYIIVLISNDFEQSLAGDGPEYHLTLRLDGQGDFTEIAPRPYRPSSIRVFLRKFALTRYYVGNLKLGDPRTFLQRMFARRPPEMVKGSDAPDADHSLSAEQEVPADDVMSDLVWYVFAEYQAIAQDGNSSVLLVMDADRAAIYNDDTPNDWHSTHTRLVSDTASDLNIDFIDLTSTFEQDYRRNGERFEYEVDRHWNERGHRLVSEVVGDWVVGQACNSTNT